MSLSYSSRTAWFTMRTLVAALAIGGCSSGPDLSTDSPALTATTPSTIIVDHIPDEDQTPIVRLAEEGGMESRVSGVLRFVDGCLMLSGDNIIFGASDDTVIELLDGQTALRFGDHVFPMGTPVQSPGGVYEVGTGAFEGTADLLPDTCSDDWNTVVPSQLETWDDVDETWLAEHRAILAECCS